VIKKVLIANRGEIAIRIIRALKELGIKSVALCPKKGEEKNFRECELADEFFYLDEEGVSGYLNAQKILRISKKSQCDAIHPGYGFLAENGDFAELCEKNGIIFIGPPSSILKILGDKIEAKKIAKKCGLPVLTGEEKVEEGKIKKVIKKLKLPVILKAADGGGGIGIEVITKDNIKGLKFIVEKLKRISFSAFGKFSVFVEKYLPNARHIEFQILGDGKKFLHFFERECSIQRRYQKLIEEAPSPFLDEKLRKKMAKSALNLAKYLNYKSLGTIEFLVDEQKNFYFIEVNPRLQVEHPVTEAITGVDLVKEQIKIAQGESISVKQDDLEIFGHAVEFRINAEDPLSDFAPSFGEIKKWQMPEGSGIQIHSFCRVGQKIYPYFDPLLLKLVVWGRNRKECLKRAKRAFEEIEIEGVKTNICLYKFILENQKFWEGKISTDFLKKEKIVEQLKEKFSKVEKEKEEKEEEEEKIAFLVASLYKLVKEEKKEDFDKWRFFSRFESLD